MSESESDRPSRDEALARFLDSEPEPGDGELLAGAMRSDERFAREVVRLLTVDDLLRQGASPDDRAFLDALELRLAGVPEGGAFLRKLKHRVRRRHEAPLPRLDVPGSPGRSRRPPSSWPG